MSDRSIKCILASAVAAVFLIVAGLGVTVSLVARRHDRSIGDQMHAIALLRHINQAQILLAAENDLVMESPHLPLDRAQLEAKDHRFRQIMAEPGLVQTSAGRTLLARILAADRVFMTTARAMPPRPSIYQAMALDAQRDRVSSLVNDLTTVHSAGLASIVATEREQRDLTAGVFIAFALSTLALVVLGFVLLGRLGEQRAHAKALEATDHLRNEFVSFAAHELRNPAAAISSGVYLLRRPETDSQTRDGALDVIAQAASALGRLVMNLLDMGRVEEGRLHLRREPILLRALIAGWLTEEQAYDPEFPKRVQVSLPEARVEADPDYICQVLSNILGNAAKHSSAGSPIEVTGEVDDGMATVHVRDSGEGIPPDRLPHIFEKYETSGDDMTGARRGVGLGLYMARMLVQAHGGRIWAQSRLGQGTTISFSLPLARPERDLTEPKRAA